MTNPVYESMTRIETSHFVARIWRNEESLERALRPDNSDLEEVARSACFNAESLLQALAAMPRVAAVEVLNEGRDGVVIYNDWP